MNEKVTQQSISDIMAFDPFPSSVDGTVAPSPTPDAPAEKKGAEGTPAAPPAAPPAKPGDKPAEPPPAAPPAPAPATPPAQPSTEALAGQVQALRDMIPQLIQSQPSAPAAPEKPHFNFQLPPQLTTALRSEDPNESATAMGILVNGMANAIRQDYVKMVQDSVIPHVVQIVQHQIAQAAEQREVIQDFYSSYPEYKTPHMMPIVAQVAINTAQQIGATSWSPALKEAIANNLKAMFPGLGTPAVPPSPPPAQRPFVPNQGARPPVPTADENANAMAGVLDSVGIKI